MNKFVGIGIAIVAIFLWFTPFVVFYEPDVASRFAAVNGALSGGEAPAPVTYQAFYQAGAHIGGIAYLMLGAAVAVAVFGYLGKSDLLTVGAVVGLLVALLFLVQAGSAAQWGLFGEGVVFAGATAYGGWQWRKAHRAKTRAHSPAR